jgi:DNA-binding protein HU-beta
VTPGKPPFGSRNRLICSAKHDGRDRIARLRAGTVPFIRGKNKEKPMSKPMTKTQLVAALAEEIGTDKKTANAALDGIAALVAREMAAGGTVTLPGLGKVACRARPERQVRNPATGETLTKPADKQVKFTIAKALKDSVN